MRSLDDAHVSYAACVARALEREGASVSPEWTLALRDVPRYHFVRTFYEQDGAGPWRAVSRDDPATHGRWQEAVASDRPLTTKLRIDGHGAEVAVSSSSKPGLMVRMLETLKLENSHRVLEIGTGTGYNAGLLCHRLGHDQVASVDNDPGLVVTARDRLAELDYKPILAVTDGAHGLPEAAPFDRIIATCSVRRVPQAWLNQLTDAGRVLVDVKVRGTSAGNLVDLRRRGGAMEGRFLSRWAGFMPMRSMSDQHGYPARLPQTVQRYTDVPATDPWAAFPVVWFIAALTMPTDVTVGTLLSADRRFPVGGTITRADGHWAEVELGARADGGHTLRASDADTWRVVEDAYAMWRVLGKPDWGNFGLTVYGPDDQVVWCKAPGGHRSWPLPT